MKTVFNALTHNPYRAPGPFYTPGKGHTGIDQDWQYEDFPSPITGTVVKTANQTSMGRTMYIQDAQGVIHIFAHLQSLYFLDSASVTRGQFIFKTGNTGTATTGPHLHYEIITGTPQNEEDKVMTRNLFQFGGYNTDPVSYLKKLYAQYCIDWKTGQKVSFPD